jgi:glycosyltransferase involved in cell wall biosynthesis
MSKLIAESGSPRRPKVSIGLPVFNGEQYLQAALDSILAQTHADFELVISDNGSTDATEDICRRYAKSDARIRYYRHDKTRGVTWNFRQVVLPSSGEYFLWVAADDRMAPNYVECCLKVLEQDGEVVLCYSKAVVVDETGTPIQQEEQFLEAESAAPHERFRELIRMDHNCGALFGLIRAHILKRTPIHGDFADSDRCVLAELALYGKFFRIPEYLFFHREHRRRVTRMFPTRQARTYKLLADRPPRLVFPHFRQFWEYVFCIQRAPICWDERFHCYLEMLVWVRDNSRRLLADLRFVVSRALRPLWKTHYTG